MSNTATMEAVAAPPAASAKEMQAFFEMSAGDFVREFRAMSDKDRLDLRRGIGDGTLTY